MNTKTQEALKMAIEALDNACIKIEKWTKGGKWTAGKEALAKCKEALEQPAFNGKEYMEGFNAGKMFAELEHPAQEVGEAEIRQMLNDIEYYQKRVKELEQPLTRDWKETIDERIAKDDKFKEALAQPAQEYCVNLRMDKCKHKNICKHCEQPAQEPVELPPIERDEDMDRTYIPIAGGWEIQTKGKGSTFRICNTKTGERKPVLDEYLQKMLETLAYENRNATHPAPAREPLSDE